MTPLRLVTDPPSVMCCEPVAITPMHFGHEWLRHSLIADPVNASLTLLPDDDFNGPCGSFLQVPDFQTAFSFQGAFSRSVQSIPS
jgi:hypothetical protein